MIVLALFQRAPYFARERHVYDRIAATAAATVVCMVADERPESGPGTQVVLLDAGEDAAKEWTVVVLTPRFGAVLTAYDQEEIDGSAATLESGRLFDGRWSLRRDDALHQALRLRALLADRLAPDVVAALDDVVARVRDLPAGAGESRADAAVRFLLEQTERDSTRLARLRRSAAPDQPVVSEPAEISHWSGAGGVTASGTLPVALLGIRVPAAHQLPEQAARRAAMLRNEALLKVLGPVLRDADRMTRLDDDTFLLMLPALAPAEAVALAHRVSADLRAAGAYDTFASATAHTVVTVTRRRPFPHQRIHQALTWAQQNGIPVATLDEE